MSRRRLAAAVGQDRLQVMPDGTVALEVRRRWTDGTTHLAFDAVELLERLAALTPRPRINLILYHGVLAPRAAWRRAVVPSSVTAPETFPAPAACEVSTEGADGAHAGRLPNRTWAERMQRSFGFDVLACPRKPGERVVTRAPTTWNSLWQPRAWLPKAMFARQRQGVREDFFLRRAAMFGLRLTVHDDLAPIPEGYARTLQVTRRIEVATDRFFRGCE